MGHMTQLGRVLELCCRGGFLIPVESLMNSTALTCYKFGPLGRTLHRNLQREWWASMRALPNVNIPDDLNDLNRHGNSKVAPTAIPAEGSSLQSLSGAAKTQPVGIARMSHIQNGDVTAGILDSSVGHSELGSQWLVPATMTTQWINDWLLQRLRWWKKFTATSGGFSVHQKKGDDNSTVIQYQLPDQASLVVETITTLENQHLSQLSSFGLPVSFSKPEPSHMIKSVSIIEPGVLAYLTDAYRNTSPMSYHGSSVDHSREYLKLNQSLSPFKVAVMVEKTGSRQYKMEVGEHLVERLQKSGLQVLDLSAEMAAHSDLLNRCDSCGIPFIVEVTERTLSAGVVQLRNRDTTLQEPMLFTDLDRCILDYVSTENVGQADDMLDL